LLLLLLSAALGVAAATVLGFAVVTTVSLLDHALG